MQLASVVQSSPGLEYLQELSTGSFGSLWLARLTMGSEVGRLVVARRMKLDRWEASRIEAVLSAGRLYRSLSHPSLVKLLEVHRTPSELIWVEEQVIGVPLAKLQEIVRAQQTSIPIHIATKLVLDAVKASDALRRACREQNLQVPEQMIFPDSVMVANFGEGLLAGVGVSNEIAQCTVVRQHRDLVDVLDSPSATEGANEHREVFTAGATLWKLLVIPGLFDNYGNQDTLDLVLHSNALKTEFGERLNLCAPKATAQVIRQATVRHRQHRFRTLREMAAAIESLPSQLLASDSQVRHWLADVAGDYLSDVQRSSGVRRVPFNLRMPVVPSALTGRPSYIPTPLPGFHSPFIPKSAPADTMPTILATSQPLDVQPDTLDLPVEVTVSSPSRSFASRRHTLRNVAISFLLLGAGVAGGYSYINYGRSARVAVASIVQHLFGTQSNSQTSPASAPLRSTDASNREGPSIAPNRASSAQSAVVPGSNSDPPAKGAKQTKTLSRRSGQARAAAPTPSSVTPGPTNRYGI